MDSEPFQRGIALFNRGEYFEAHEVLEEVWRAASTADKKFLQSLIQVAVGLHHYGNHNREGARSLLARAHRNLQPYAETYGGVNLSVLRAALGRAADALAGSGVVDVQSFKL
ncbi:MAG: DUF309 domain-containing protein [Terriglobales bacterium]